MYRRAPFIWTAKQPIDAAGAFRAFFEAPARRDDGKNRWFLFRRRFELPGPADAALVTLTVDGRYQLFVNGRRIGRGPVRCDPHYQRTDTHDLRTHVHAGDNVIALLVHVYGIDTAWYQAVQGHWQPAFGDGGVYCDGSVRCGERVIDVLSDEQWRCLECDAWERDTPRANWGLGFIEVHDARRLPERWADPDFDDSEWDRVQVLSVGGGAPDSMLGGVKIEPFPTLVPRAIPVLAESPLAPVRLVASYAVVPNAELPVDRRLYEEALQPLAEGAVGDPEALLRADERVTTVRTSDGRDVSLLLDFGRIHSGYPFIDVEAHGGEVIEVAVAEGIPGEWDSAPPAAPRISRDSGHGAHVFRYIARPGRQRFERFEWAAVRYAQLTVRNAPHGLRVRHVGSTFAHYPAEARGHFECSDPLLTRLWEVGRYTLQLCMHDGWEDCPGREQRQWLGDATVEFLVGQAAFGPSVNALNRQFLQQAAESQRPDGLTQMYAPGDHRTNGMLIPDWTLQWILNAEQHLLYTGEVETIEAVFPAIQRALAWFERQIGPHDLVAELPYWHFHDWAALGRHGEAATLNAVLVGALRAAATLARALESERAARHYVSLAERLAAALNVRHWDAERGVYVDVVDPATGKRDRRVSQHANAALILWDIAPRARWASMIEWISDPARLVFTAAPPIVPSGAPFDPQTNVVLANTFFSHFVYRALCRAGRCDLVLALMRERYGRMLARGATTLWESYEPTASLCHGFSATPVYQLSTEVLGVYPTAPGFARFRLRPLLGDLQSARGLFPTVKGDIKVQWTRRADRVDIDVTVPDGTEGEAIPPLGYGASDSPSLLDPGRHGLRFEVRDKSY
ncbi:MAG TPA: alpha-L-rhamnosidase C-terminal domain-containing protein [Candidatus Margulisiibacteriota bacterium]|nr:alpha-L-rhamnosidase C-terminal domain-containing protein [Candidatus Margulisiibacteriota bacterium]